MMIQSDILAWAALGTLCTLYFGISTTVTGLTESDKIRQLVCIFVSLHAK
jgi:hypothetical protein